MTEERTSRKNGLATAGMVLGVVGLIVPAVGLLAIIIAAMGLKNADQRGGRKPAIAGLALGFAGMVLWVVGTTIYLNQFHAKAMRARCTANMRKIGVNIIMYAQDYRGLPPNLQILVDEKRIAAEDLRCPTDPSGSDSYVYLGAKNTRNWRHGASAFVMAYEKSTKHRDGRVNVMLGDGSVDSMTPAELEAVLNMPANKPN